MYVRIDFGSEKMKKCVMIYNKKSGKIKSEDIEEKFYEIVKKYDYDLEIISTKKKGDGEHIMKSLPDSIDLVISAGGDGTFNEVIKGNIKRKKKLLMAHLPLGTTNDVGAMYGYGKDYIEDLEMIFNGVKKNIDVIMVNGNPFVYVAAFGNFINISFDTPKKLKERFGRFGYILFGLSEVKEKIRINHIKYTVDGITKEGDYSFIFVTNSNRIGGIKNIYQDIKLDDNKFEVVFCPVKTKFKLLRILSHIKFHGVENIPGCEYYSTSNMKIEFEEKPSYSWGLDGEEFISDDKVFDFSINKDINILLPTTNIDKLFVNK